MSPNLLQHYLNKTLACLPDERPELSTSPLCFSKFRLIFGNKDFHSISFTYLRCPPTLGDVPPEDEY
jgi:hypothetical protein